MRRTAVVLSVLASWLVLAPDVVGAQTAVANCTSQDSGSTCTVPPGSYSAPLQYGTGSGATLDITNQGVFEVHNPAGYAIRFFTQGTNAGTGGPGGSAGNLTANDAGSLTVTRDYAEDSAWMSAMLVQVIGGNGGPATKSTRGGNGGSAGALTFTNSAPVSIVGYFPSGLSGLEATSSGGGSGFDNDDSGTGQAGDGGRGGDVELDNSGAIAIGTATNPTATSGFNGAWAVAALSTGASGAPGSSTSGGAPGGASGRVVVSSTAPVSLYGWFAPANPSEFRGYFGIVGSATGGDGAATATKGTRGGPGGEGVAAMVNVDQGAVSIYNAQDTRWVNELGGDFAGAGVAAIATGGAGGAGWEHAPGGSGGAAGAATVTVNNASVAAEAPFWGYLPAIRAESTGGDGGDGTVSQDTSGGGVGGAGGAATVVVGASGAGAPVVSTFGVGSPAINAASRGGSGGIGAEYNRFGFSGNGGDGGAGGTAATAAVTLQNHVWAATYMAESAAIVAGSYGGNGGVGGLYGGGLDGDGGAGGAGGNAGEVSVLLADDSLATTADDGSPGVEAVSSGGTGGAGGHSGDPFYAEGGDGGRGGNGNAVSVAVETGARITTAGQDSAGIIAQSFGAGGGAGGSADSLDAPPGDPGAGGSSGTVTVTNAGRIETGGASSQAILAQVLSGSGGAGGTSISVFYGAGTSGGTPGILGDLSIANSGSIYTVGAAANGILAQSISGGGGVGGNASGAIVSIGGDSAQGADGGAASATVGGSVTTEGDASAGAQVQSIGGGGGTAGGAETDGLGIGGSGASGGNGGPVSIALDGQVLTAGAYSDGIMGQSIGGGGGSGGLSDSFVAVGGTGAATGAGGSVAIGASAGSSATTSGDLAAGLLAQSVGGGGGSGGDALQGLVSVGGTGSGGGNGGSAVIDSAGAVTTMGDLAPGLLAMSVGGGGGIGGSSTSYGVGASVSIGGSAGGGGTGGDATIATTAGAVVSAWGTNAPGIAAMSVGGGGGTGGSGYAITGSAGFGASLAVGGTGGDGGNGSLAEVDLAGARVATGLGVQAAVDPATVPNGAPIPPLPISGYGAVALSVGGGGGAGGSAMAKAYVMDVPSSPEPGSPNFAVSAAFAVGGSGGNGGDGGRSSLNVSDGTRILTYGNDAHAVLAASIGGGGGLGGDSSALATSFGFKSISRFGFAPGEGGPKPRPNYNLNLSVSVGGTGGGGGEGGDVGVTLGGHDGAADPETAQPVAIQTLGDYAYGAFAQSIGGGGGNAGVGAGSTQNGTWTGTALSMSVGVGASGGGGGNGGNVSVDEFGDATVATAGDTAYGIFAQSVGGGGGNSSGSSYQFGFPSLQVLELAGKQPLKGDPYNMLYTIFGGIDSSVAINAGTDGAGGGDGGAVAVAVRGTVATTGEAATAVFAQSVGGGGGEAGSAGSSGSSDDPTVLDGLKTGKAFVDDLLALPLDYLSLLTDTLKPGTSAALALRDLFPSLNLNLSFGAQGGGGGNGGPVSIELDDGKASTVGDWATAVQAQSIGGGGGDGGGAVAGGSAGFGNMLKINFDVALGGKGGSGGTGGSVGVTLNGATIATAGYAAFGVFAQSVGGGGGKVGSAESNSGGVFSLGATSSGDAASGGNGGPVTVSQVAGTSGVSGITTRGDAAHAVLLQSVGGGGGLAGDGFALEANFTQWLAASKTFHVGGNGAWGSGGKVELAAADLPELAIATSGASAYGILAQSVGGGGGLAFTNPGTGENTNVTGGHGTADSSGGDVAIHLRDGSTIRTSGDGATGIFAQSVGGGGGIANFASGPALLYEATSNDGPGAATNGSGGAVGVDTGDTAITTTGASAFGVFAQSIGGGGGLQAGNDGVSMIAGTTGSVGSTGSGGAITIVQSGSITASGENSVGIAAQSAGPQQNQSIDITVNGTVLGGSGAQGAGVWVMDGATPSVLTVADTGSVAAASGVAVTYTGATAFNVYNYGTIIGSVSVKTTTGNGSGTVYNHGTWNPGVENAANVVNDGRIVLAGNGRFDRAAITGDFTQAATGTLVLDADFANARADLLAVGGDADLAGRVVVQPASVLPGRPVTVLAADGAVSGALQAAPSALFGYGLSRSGGDVILSVEAADFAPAGFALRGAGAELAAWLAPAFDAASTPAIGTLFAALGNLADGDPASYADALDQLSPGIALAFASRARRETMAFGDALSGRCRSSGAARTVATTDGCAWMEASGTHAHQDDAGGYDGFTDNTFDFRGGAQREVASGWTVGGALGYVHSSIDGRRGATGSGDAGYVGADVVRGWRGWRFTGAIFGSFSSNHTNRPVTIPGFAARLQGNPDIDTQAALVGVDYTFNLGHRHAWYVRPALTAAVVRVHADGFQTAGEDTVGLGFSGSSDTSGVFEPTVEFGVRTPLGSGMRLRSYVKLGASLPTDSTFRQPVRLLGADAAAGTYDASIPSDATAGLIEAGVDLYTAPNFELRLAYHGAFASHLAENAGMLQGTVRF